MAQHHYKLHLAWSGNKGTGTSSYTNYERSHTISIEGKPDLLASSDVPFRGDGTKHNPEDLLLASLSSCHMLWYLHLCADAGVIVMEYEDAAEGLMKIKHGIGRFAEVTLHPIVKVAEEGMCATAIALHHEAHKNCFIANSVNFPVRHQPICSV